MELFVPGRVCLFGEHTDWAGGFRRFNKKIDSGVTLVTGTNQGIYARVAKHPTKIVVTCKDNNGESQHAEFNMDSESLLKVAREGGFWSYIAGVVYKMQQDHVIGGLQLDNYLTTLPLRKGLSSSAAICVLTARALNKLYDLRLTVRGEMEYAYQGELVTPSQCGRLDQACAFGSTPVCMTYDGEFTGVEKINVSIKLHYVLVDLRADKDTTQILADLQSAYPFPQTKAHEKLHECLGKENQAICKRAQELLARASGTEHLSEEQVLEELGGLMNKAQELFDAYARPVCPSQLEAPVLHKCLGYESLQKHIYGGKYVGAGGDGTAQLLCRSAQDQSEVARIVKDELNMDPLLLTISPSSKIQTAVIPAGGFAGTLFPASQACKAELFPVFDPRDGLCKPLILQTVEQLLDAGLEKVVLVVQEDDLHQFKRLFEENVSPGNMRKLPADSTFESYARKVIDMGRRIQYVVQSKQMGFGHAVFCAKDFVSNKPFLLVLGHHLYLSDPKTGSKTCVEQIIEAHKQVGTNVVGLKKTPVAEVHAFGAVGGTFKDDHLINISTVVEKPSLEFAKQNLQIPGLTPDESLTMFGIYALEPTIFAKLGHYVEHDIRDARGEIAFTPALEDVRRDAGLAGILIDGERLPITTPEAFIRTNQRLLDLHVKQTPS